MAACTHLDSVKVTELPVVCEGCVDCLVSGGVRGAPPIAPSPMGCP